MHNPVFTEEDIRLFGQLIAKRGLSEGVKPATRDKLAERIKLFHEVIQAGLHVLDSSDTKAISAKLDDLISRS